MASPRHRGTVRPRFGRLTALGASVSVVVVALLGAAGAWETSPPAAVAETAASVSMPAHVPAQVPAERPAAPPPVDPTAVPAGSGEGRRIVFDQSAQRVWLVGAGDTVARSYLVSGSVVDNLRPGSYAVYSRSRWAVGVDDSGVMEYFVRFTRGPGGAAIGFHTIPTKHGTPLQALADLGTPRSHGCIRQRTRDAIALWEFAPEWTRVVVVA